MVREKVARCFLLLDDQEIPCSVVLLNIRVHEIFGSVAFIQLIMAFYRDTMKASIN